MNRLLILILTLFISDYAFAQISTDRPDQTESSLVLPKGTIQIESGFVSRKNELIFPNTLFRIGISKKFEFRINTNYIFKTNEYENKISNFSDLEIGTKIQIYNSETSKTSIAFLTHLSIPSANKYYSNNTTGLLSRILISHELNNNFGIGYNIGYNKFKDEEGDIVYTVALGKGINSWGIYCELYGNISDSKSDLYFDGGLVYLLKDNLQLDISYGTGINNTSNYFSAGVSWAFNLF